MKTEITQIRIKLKERDIELSADEARQIQRELNLLFEIEKTDLKKLQESLDELEPKKEYVPWPYPVYPIVIDRNPKWNPPYWETWCKTTGGIGSGETLCISLNQ